MPVTATSKLSKKQKIIEIDLRSQKLGSPKRYHSQGGRGVPPNRLLFALSNLRSQLIYIIYIQKFRKKGGFRKKYVFRKKGGFRKKMRFCIFRGYKIFDNIDIENNDFSLQKSYFKYTILYLSPAALLQTRLRRNSKVTIIHF